MTSETKKENMLSTLVEVKTMRKDLNELLLSLDNLVLELTNKLEQINE